MKILFKWDKMQSKVKILNTKAHRLSLDIQGVFSFFIINPNQSYMQWGDWVSGFYST